MKKTKIILIIIILIGAYFLFFNQDNWIGFYYPNKDDLTQYVNSSKLKSLEECRKWVDSQVSIHNSSGYGYDYECGKNCKFDDDYELYICKETLN